MSRQDYGLIFAEVSRAIDRAWSRRWAALDTHSGQHQLQLDMGAVIDALADTFENLPGFDRAQFVEACEGGVW